ncbi:6660_t:CDS:2 [Dentiscutata heterogama]|uniref:6660_t:CDS:1 n=1 Tax=Dentiscutata heterogama TaxID=1316150 RepID=A0ACA9MEK8_9GLOM|nr:6660_t:CDS:2 [Dentiscutata heterogama]
MESMKLIPIARPVDKQVEQINVNGVGWLPLALFRNYSQWSNETMSMETAIRPFFRSYTTDPSLKRPGPIPLGDPKEQKEFEELVRKNQGSFTSAIMAVEEEELQVHPDAREKLPAEFEGEKNPVTGEIGGPKQDPLKHGDWIISGRIAEIKSRVTECGKDSSNSKERNIDDNAHKTTRGKKKNRWKIPPGLTEKEARILKKVKKRAEFLDIGLCVCCCFKVGLDPIIGLIPVVGDFMSTFLSLMLIKTAKEVDLPKYVISQMVFNVFIDFMLGLVPVVGDFFDFLYQANIRNAILLENFLVDRAKNRSVVMEDGSVEVLHQPERPEKAAPGRDRSGRY